jgi:tetratricopeptide (TPR) repeat protein
MLPPSFVSQPGFLQLGCFLIALSLLFGAVENSAEANSVILKLDRKKFHQLELAQEDSQVLIDNLRAEAEAAFLDGLQNGDLSISKSIWVEIIQIDPSYTDAYVYLGSIAFLDSHYEEAESWYRRAIEFSPSDPNLYLALALSLENQGLYSEAEAIYRQMIAFDSANVQAYVALGNCLSSDDRDNEAEHVYRQAIQIDPNYVEAYISLGLFYMLQGRYPEQSAVYEEAIDVYHQAISHDASDAQAYENLGVILLQQGKLGEAETAFRQAIRLAPEMSTAYENRLYRSRDGDERLSAGNWG